MRILLVGTGGVGAAFAAIAARRTFYDAMVVADYDAARAEKAAAVDDRFVAAQIDASDAAAVTALCREHGITHVMNAVDPVFNMSIFEGAFAAGADYVDMAMSLSQAAPGRAVQQDGREARRRAVRGRLASGRAPAASPWSAWASSPVSPTSSRGTPPTTTSPRSTSSARATAPTSSSPTTTATRSSRRRSRCGPRSRSASTRRSIWQDGEWHTTAPFSEPEVFDFPEGIGPVECVNVEHEEVLLMPRWVDCKRATFKYGLGDEFINILKVLHTLGLDRTEKVRVKGVEVSPRDVVAAVLPDPATVGPRMKGKTCAGLWVTGTGKDGERRGRRTTTTWSTTSGRCRSTATSASSGRPRSTPSSRSSCSPAAPGAAPACSGPEAFDAVPFLDLLTEYGSPWGRQEVSG